MFFVENSIQLIKEKYINLNIHSDLVLSIPWKGEGGDIVPKVGLLK